MAVVFPSISRAVGTYLLPSSNVPNGISSAVLSFDRSLWTNPAGKMEMQLEISFDNGTSWQILGAFTAEGGVVLDMLGNVATKTSIKIGVPQPQNNNRKVRGTLIISGAAFTTSGILTLA